MYFNARFDDVMLIVEREMASVLRGPLPVILGGCIVFFSFVLFYIIHSTFSSPPRKLKFPLIHVSCVLKGLFCCTGLGHGCIVRIANLS